MRTITRLSQIVGVFVLAAGCSGEKEPSELRSKISIESYSVSDHESELISKTGVGQIEYFKLNGNLAEDENLQFSIEVFKNGELQDERLRTTNDPERTYKDSLISFGIGEYTDEKRPFKLISGFPSGFATTNYPHDMTSFTFNKLVKSKITLQKHKPAYLASWQGTTKNELSSVLNEKAELPENLDETELVFLYKVLWTDVDASY